MLDDPTNIALSQRAPAHLQQGRDIPPPHGGPLLQAAQAEPGEQQVGVKEPLPVRGMPSKQGEWVRKRGVLVLFSKTCCATSAHKQQKQMHVLHMFIQIWVPWLHQEIQC